MGHILSQKTGVERMKTRENTTTFESMNEEATEFYNRHGWVVIHQRLNEMTVDEARVQLQLLLQKEYLHQFQ